MMQYDAHRIHVELVPLHSEGALIGIPVRGIYYMANTS